VALVYTISHALVGQFHIIFLTYDTDFLVHGVIIGTGANPSLSSAEEIAATQALQHLHAHGIPDPVRKLSDYLQAFRIRENLVQYLGFASVQSGPVNETMYHATYTCQLLPCNLPLAILTSTAPVCDVVVGRGSGTARGIAKCDAGSQALQYFRTYAVPPIPELRHYHNFSWLIITYAHKQKWSTICHIICWPLSFGVR